MSFLSWFLLGLFHSIVSLSVVSREAEKPVFVTNTTDKVVLGLEGGDHVAGRRLTLSSAQKEGILNKHNTLRANVATPCTATDMETLQWDDTLALKAEEHAARCTWEHDNAVNQPNRWGENMALSVTGTSLEGLIQGFYDEIVDVQWTAGEKTVTAKVYADWQYCESPAHGKCQITHYTQLVWAETNKVGCGWARCDYVSLLGLGGEFLVCKYSPGGNLDDGYGNVYAPFQVGQPGAFCSYPASGVGASGKLCAPGDTPNRCRDELGYEMLEVFINEDRYTDCATLMEAFKEYGNWCTDFAMANAEQNWCALSCKECSVPANVGPSYCPSSYVAEAGKNLTGMKHKTHQGLRKLPKDRSVSYTIASRAQVNGTDVQRAMRSKRALGTVGSALRGQR